MSSTQSTTESTPTVVQLIIIPLKSKLDQFRLWKVKVETYLDSLGVAAELTKVKSEKVNSDLNKKVKSFLLLSVDMDALSILSNIKDSSASEIWAQLCSHHERDSTASRLQLKSLLLSDKLRPNEKINEFICRIINTVERLQMIGKPPDDEDKLFCLLNGIKSNPEFGMISEILKSSENMTFDKACHRLQDREVEAFTKLSVKNDSVNYVNKQNKYSLSFNENSQSKTIFCNYCKKKGHKYENCDKRLKRCHRCHKTSHQIKN